VKRARAIAAGLASLAIAGHGTADVLACGEALPSSRRMAESPSYLVAWHALPMPPRVGEHFVVDLAVCPKAGSPPPGAVRVDATMPEHRHGMNYRPSVATLGAGRYRAQGLMFHMPGRWVMEFDIAAGTTIERATSEIVLK